MTGSGRPRVSPNARRLIDCACALADAASRQRCGLNHYLQAVMQADEHLLCSVTGGSMSQLPKERLRSMAAKKPGRFLSVAALLRDALEMAQARGADTVWDVDVVAAVLRRAGIYGGPLPVPSEKSPGHALPFELPTKLLDIADGSEEEESGGDRAHTGSESGSAHTDGRREKTSALDEFGRDVTAEAVAGKLAPMVGRDAEVQACIEVLCRVSKRNPVLIGPAGVGKTAIVEGLALRVARGEVPLVLAGSRVVEIRMTSVVAKLAPGVLEDRINRILIEASHGDTILFIDELHMVLGGGQTVRDVSQMLKPALARGDVAVVGATTDDEYRRIVEQDAALERRFQPVIVPEMDRATALDVLKAHRDRLQALRGVALADDILDWLVGFADDYMHNRHFPDKALDMLDQCIAHAVFEGKSELDRETAESVAQRLVGMPLGIGDRLVRLEEQLTATAILSDDDMRALIDRLRVTMGGHDFDPARPNATILLTGLAADRADLLAAICSEALYGSAQRVVSIDFAGLQAGDDSALTQLLGMPYGYVGADLNKGAVQVLNSQPWTSVVLRNVDLCDRLFRTIVANALVRGYFVDAHSVKQYLSDAVVFLTASEIEAKGGRLGFVADDTGTQQDIRGRLERLLGKAVTSQCQIVSQTGPAEMAARGWFTQIALPALNAALRPFGAGSSSGTTRP